MNAMKQVTKRHPSWLNLNADGTGYVLNQRRADVIQEIFGLSEEGMGDGAIAERLFELRTEPFSSTNGWEKKSVEYLLTTRTVFGERRHKGKVIPNYYPAVITESQFIAVQRSRADRKNKGGTYKGKTHFLFAGMLKCGYCNNALTFDSGSIVCCKSKVGKDDHYLAMWDYMDFEQTVLTHLPEIAPQELLATTSKTLIELVTPDNRDKREPYRLRRKLRTRISRLFSYLRVYPVGMWYVQSRFNQIEEYMLARKVPKALVNLYLDVLDSEKYEGRSVVELHFKDGRFRVCAFDKSFDIPAHA